MLTDEFIESLPDDPTEAFFISTDHIESGHIPFNLRTVDGEQKAYEFARHISSIQEALGISIIPDLSTSPDYTDFEADFLKWKQELDQKKSIHRIKSVYNARKSKASVSLSSDIKAEMHKHTSAIRTLVNSSGLRDNKQEAIINKISALEKEIDKDRTKPEAVTALMIEMCAGVSDAAEKLDPAIERLNKIFKLFGLGFDQQESKRIEAPEEKRLLEDKRKDNEAA